MYASSRHLKTAFSGQVEVISLGWLSAEERDNSDFKHGWVELVSLGRQSTKNEGRSTICCIEAD